MKLTNSFLHFRCQISAVRHTDRDAVGFTSAMAVAARRCKVASPQWRAPGQYHHRKVRSRVSIDADAPHRLASASRACRRVTLIGVPGRHVLRVRRSVGAGAVSLKTCICLAYDVS